MMSPEYVREIKMRILRLRKGAKMSARDLSLALDLNPSYISQIEGGKATPSLQSLLAICDYFKISPKDFFDDGLKSPYLLGRINEGARELDEMELFIINELIKKLISNRELSNGEKFPPAELPK